MIAALVENEQPWCPGCMISKAEMASFNFEYF